MQYLCLAYGEEKDWLALSEREQKALLAQDEVLRERGDLVAAVGNCTTLRVQKDEVVTSSEPFAPRRAPLAGFSLIEARDLDEAIELLASTPCAVANGAIEIWPIL